MPESKPVLLASDIHSGAGPPAHQRAFLDWLDYAAVEASAIVINGDLFDFWFEYRTGTTGGHGDLLSKLNIARKKKQVLPEEQCLGWLRQIVGAVQYIHSQRVLHRDLKLANCFVTSGGVVKVGDYGLACQLPEGCEMAEEKVGTITAMAPELVAHGYATYKSDVWALGSLIYQLATHGPVFEVPFDSFGLDIHRYKAAMSRPFKPIP